MLIDITKYGIQANGVIHVGAHYGQEVPTYKKMGIKKIVLIEPQHHCIPKLKKIPGVEIHHLACGSRIDRIEMHISPQNQGQSNSLLRPALHRKQHPDIIFTHTEWVDVVPLDLVFYNTDCDLLVMDVQGYELEVLKGAKKTLEIIDWVYTEVNRDETYVGCARVEQLDAFLTDFVRIETKWVGIWGDALYKRKQS